MMKDLFMGIDIGTSGVRATLFDIEGKLKGLHHIEYPLICSSQGMAELDPQQVFSSFIKAAKDCIDKTGAAAEDINAVGISSQMHSLIAADHEGNCLTNTITWADTRSARYAQMIKEKFDYVKLYEKTGCRVHHSTYPLSKILWLKSEMPEIYSKTSRFLTIKGYILYRLTGEYMIDISDASATGIFNTHHFEWDDDILKEVLGIGRDMLAQPVECIYVCPNIKEEFAKQMGLIPGTPFVIGSTDGVMANLGAGVFDSTAMSCTIGTSGALRIAVDKPLLDKYQRTWCYCFTRDTWVAGGAINNAGVVLRWLRNGFRQQFEHDMNTCGEKNIYSLFDRYASEIPPGSEGLTFIPLLAGERSPNWRADVTGTIHGLTLMHSRKHLIRAAMEGVMFRLLSVYEIISAINSNVKQVMANGGYVNSEIWMQMQADMFEREIVVAGVGESAALGSAYTAMVGVDALKNFKQKLPAMEPVKIIKPVNERREAYRKAYECFKQLYSKVN